MMFTATFSRKPRALFAGLVFAQTVLFAAQSMAAPAVIAERKEGFKAMGVAMKTINAELKKESPDAAAMTATAAKLVAAAEKIPNWFPVGSGPEAGVETDALPYIWKAKDKFDQTSNKLILDTKALAAATSGADVAAIKKQLITVKDTCSSCHESFRAD